MANQSKNNERVVYHVTLMHPQSVGSSLAKTPISGENLIQRKKQKLLPNNELNEKNWRK